MSREPQCFVFLTGDNGLAYCKTVPIDEFRKLLPRMGDCGPVVKTPASFMDFHHPPDGTVIVVELTEGIQKIKVSDGKGGHIDWEQLTGDFAVFMDWKPETEPTQGHSGHASLAGDSGCKGKKKSSSSILVIRDIFALVS